jgi:hypothetical protein
METLTRTINTALQLARAHGIQSPGHIDQLIGSMARKLTDGLNDRQIYDHGYRLAITLANDESKSTAIENLIEQVRRTGNPLTNLQAM